MHIYPTNTDVNNYIKGIPIIQELSQALKMPAYAGIFLYCVDFYANCAKALLASAILNTSSFFLNADPSFLNAF